DDDHHYQYITEWDSKAGLQILETAGVVVLILGLDGHGLLQGQLAIVYGLKRSHHNGNLAGTSRRDHHVAMAVFRLACRRGCQVPASMERQFVAELVEVSDQHIQHDVSPVLVQSLSH